MTTAAGCDDNPTDDGWLAATDELCVACGELTPWRDHNGVPLCRECAAN